MLAKHIAHLFIRDALVTYDDYAEKDDMQSSEHFEVFFYHIHSYSIEYSIIQLAKCSMETTYFWWFC